MAEKSRPKGPNKTESLSTLKKLIQASSESLTSAIPGMSDSSDTVSDSLSRLAGGFASQIYGVDPQTGEVKVAGPHNLAADLSTPDVGPEPPKFVNGALNPDWNVWVRAKQVARNRKKITPGIVSDTASLPNMFGNGPAWSRYMQDLADRTHQGVNRSMDLAPAQGFRQHAFESAGMMAGQVPSEGLGLLKQGAKEAAPVAKGALQVLKRYGKGLALSPFEFFLPTVEPKASNYLFGTVAGGALGSLGDDVPEPPKSKAISHGYAGGGKVKIFSGALDAARSKSGRRGMFSVLDQLIEEAPFEKATPEQWKKYLKPGREAVREDVRFPLRANELEWAGPAFDAVMKSDGSVRRDELLDYLRHGNQAAGSQLGGRPQFVAKTAARFTDPRWRSQGGIEGSYHEDLTQLDDPDFPGYEGSHFPSKTISWSRRQTLPENELLVDEIQSDLHQAATTKLPDGKRLGYASRGERPKDLDDLFDEYHETISDLANRRFRQIYRRNPNPNSDLDTNRYYDLLSDAQEEFSFPEDGQPTDAPFRDEGWIRHELQKSLLHAAKNNFDTMSVVHPSNIQTRYGDNPGLGKFYEVSVIPELEKLAKRYGAEFDPGGAEIRGTSPVENTWNKLHQELSGVEVPDDVDEEEMARSAQYVLDLAENHGFDLDRLPSARRILQHVADFTPSRYDPQAVRVSIASIRNQIQDDLDKKTFESQLKRNPKIKLSPELREKILRIGVPLYGLGAGAVMMNQDDDQPQQYAEGGKVGALAQALRALNLNPKATLSAKQAVEADPEAVVKQAVSALPPPEQANYLNRIFSGDTESVIEALEQLHRRLFPSQVAEAPYKPQPPPQVADSTSHGRMSNEEFNRRVLGIAQARGGLASMLKLIRSH